MSDGMSDEAKTIVLTGAEAAYLREILEERRTDLRERKNPPKGWTYGKAQDALSHSTAILNLLG